jgi:hypothetical protein
MMLTGERLAELERAAGHALDETRAGQRGKGAAVGGERGMKSLLRGRQISRLVCRHYDRAYVWCTCPRCRREFLACPVCGGALCDECEKRARREMGVEESR